MIVYRLCKSRFSRDLSGKGAEISGGRWNGKGTPMLYTSGSRALCMVEIAVHTPFGNLPSDYEMLTISIPDSSMNRVDPLDLPHAWKSFPFIHETQLMGDRFIRENKFLVLKVPSAVVQGDFNFLVNPLHKDFRKVKLVRSEAFDFDARLFKKADR